MTSRDDDVLGVPAFGRIEIALPTRDSITKAARELRALADSFDAIAADHDDDTARLLAYRHTRATSKKLRGSK